MKEQVHDSKVYNYKYLITYALHLLRCKRKQWFYARYFLGILKRKNIAIWSPIKYV